MANDRVQVSELGAAISTRLTIWGDEVNEEIERVTKEAMDDLVKRTRSDAPTGHRRGHFKRSITSKKLDMKRGAKYVWYVKAPDYRLTHLLVHGHATRNGGRTRGNPFLSNALGQVLPEYEKNIKEAISRAGR